MSAPLVFGREMLDRLTAAARQAPRLRMNSNVHSSFTHPSQRVLNAMEPDSYARPHRHPVATKDETFLVARGAFGLFVFDEGGNVTEKALLRAGGDFIGGNVPAGIFHTLVSLETGSVFFEAKAGPYDAATDKEWAPWAPQEGQPEARRYLARLKRLLQQH